VPREDKQGEGVGGKMAGKDEEITQGTERTKRTTEPGIRAKHVFRLFKVILSTFFFTPGIWILLLSPVSAGLKFGIFPRPAKPFLVVP